MGQAKLRRRLVEAATSGSIPEGGLFFLHRRHGISVILVVRRLEGERVHAGLFCVDDWQEGLFRCLDRVYESASVFQAEFKANSHKFRPALAEDCRRRAAMGLRVRRLLQTEPPAGFSVSDSLLGAMDATLPESLYLCPRCESPLSPEVCDKILSGIKAHKRWLILCDQCLESANEDVSFEETVFPHQRLKGALEKMGTFSITFEEDKTLFMMSTPGPDHREAIATFDEDPVMTAAFALESWMNRATRANEVITDHHVEQALDELIESRRAGRLVEKISQEVDFVTDAAEEGLVAFSEVCKDKWDHAARDRAATAAVEKVLESVQRHLSQSDARSYCKFIAKYMK